APSAPVAACASSTVSCSPGSPPSPAVAYSTSSVSPSRRAPTSGSDPPAESAADSTMPPSLPRTGGPPLLLAAGQFVHPAAHVARRVGDDAGDAEGKHQVHVDGLVDGPHVHRMAGREQARHEVRTLAYQPDVRPDDRRAERQPPGTQPREQELAEHHGRQAG